MKKIFLGLAIIFLISGCSVETKEKNKEVVKGSMNCIVEDSVFTLELEDGQIVKYIDSVDGELSQETVDILNEEYLTGVTSNTIAVTRMNEGLKDLGGHCE